MRVLHAIWSLSPTEGGPPIALAGFAAAQARAGHIVSVAATWVDGEPPLLADGLRSGGVAVHMVGPCRGRQRRHPELASTLARLVAGADVVHLHGVWDHVQHVAARAARERGVPYVVTPHGMLERYCLAQKWLKKRLYLAWRLARDLRGAAAIHFTSRQEADATGPRAADQVDVVEPWGLDWHEFEPLPARGEFRRRHAIGDTRPVLLFLGRVVPKKGPDVLLQSVVQTRNADALLVIAGPISESYRAVLGQVIGRHKLQDRVLFTGMLHGRERVEALVDADLFVLPSWQENFGIAVAEALAAGTAVVISDRVALSALVRSADVGGVAPPEPVAIARHIDDWLERSRSDPSVSSHARAVARTHFDWQSIARRWSDHYAGMLRLPRPPAAAASRPPA
jgi:glycosyltransferase involved in cell wall biosynthesis